jgi:thiol-disulfide isomerase/thioredoxin
MVRGLVAAVVLVWMMCVLNLLLIAGVIRRLRAPNTLLPSRPNLGAARFPAVGAKVGAFVATTVDGERLSNESLVDGSLVAFFSSGCPPCHEMLPEFIGFAALEPKGRDQVVTVVVAEGRDRDEMVSQLRRVARVLVEVHSGAVHEAFGVRAYPTVLRVSTADDGQLLVTDSQVALVQPGVVAA